jgi:hypothetical protein
LTFKQRIDPVATERSDPMLEAQTADKPMPFFATVRGMSVQGQKTEVSPARHVRSTTRQQTLSGRPDQNRTSYAIL